MQIEQPFISHKLGFTDWGLKAWDLAAVPWISQGSRILNRLCLDDQPGQVDKMVLHLTWCHFVQDFIGHDQLFDFILKPSWHVVHHI